MSSPPPVHRSLRARPSPGTARPSAAAARAACVAALVAAAPAAAEEAGPAPCADAIIEPAPTPLRDAAFDAQRSACVRDALGVHLLADVLIDTPGFHGELSGDARLAGRIRLRPELELDLGVRLARYAFVQNAVNKATAVQLGPVSLGAVWAHAIGAGTRVALAGALELPYTRDEIDTLHVGGELGGVVTTSLAARTLLHARLGAVAGYASSSGGDVARRAVRAGADVVRRLGRVLAVSGGADVQAGWHGGLDHVLVRAGGHSRLGERWRLLVGLGVPVAGDERSNVVFDLGIAHDLR